MIIYLLGSLNRGGTETLMLDVFRNARQNGLDAKCFYRKGGVCETDFVASGVSMYHYPTGKNLIRYVLGLRKRLLVEQAEVVHAMQPLDALYAWLATRGTKIKVIQTLHGFDFDESQTSKSILKFILPRTFLNIYVSYHERSYYQVKYKLQVKKQQVAYNGISFDKLDKAIMSALTIRDEFELSGDTLLFGMIGNFNSGRDHLTVCRFLKLLDAHDIDFRFIFVGKRVSGQEALYDQCVSYCKEQGIADKVIFAGVRQDVPVMLKQLDAFVYSTAHDTFGIAVVEAMASGLPVFVNDWPVMQEISQQGKCATIYKSADPQDLLEQFLAFVNDRRPYREKARLASDDVRQRFSIQSHIQRLLEIYNYFKS